jgi:FSR family fosmidomycin resistance protein-like MFS transporter
MLRNRPLMTLAASHFTIDTYPGLLPVLFPLLIDRFGLNYQTVGLASLAFVGCSSLSQPLFGWLADRTGTRWIGLTVIWTAILFGIAGFAPTYELLLLCVALSGLGSGAFHPFGALNAAATITSAQRNTAMSVYVTGGTLGVACGPLLGVIFFWAFGLQGTILAMIPGLIFGVWLFRVLGAQDRQRQSQPPPIFNRHLLVLPLIAVIGVMMSRTWTIYSIEAFVPSWYESLGYSAAFYAPLATVLLLASAIGTIGCGSLADRFGRRTVIIVALFLTIPAILLFAWFPGPLGFVSAILLGASAASTGPLTLMMAQQLMVGRAGLASGLVLGIGFVTGAIGAPVTGWFADQFGMQLAMSGQILVVLATIPLALLLPNEAVLQRASQQELT